MSAGLRRMIDVRHPRIVGPISLGHGVNEFFAIAIPPIIPLLVTDLGISYAQAGFLLTVFFIMYTVFQLPAGVLADWLGKRRLLIFGLAGMSLAILFASTADGYGMLLVAQAIAGICGSTFHPTGMSIISDAETEGTEGRAMGVFGFGGAIGTLTSPLLIGGLAAIAGWRVALAGAAILGLAVTASFIVLYRRDSAPTSTNTSTEIIDESVAETLQRAVGGLLAVPLSRGTVLLFFITLILSLQHRAIHTFTTSYVVAETGASVSFGNIVFFVLLFGGSLSSLWAGDLADTFDRTLLGGITALLTALLVGATLLLAALIVGIPPWATTLVLGVWFFLIGLLMYAAYPVKNALISEQAEAEFSGSLFGIIQTASAIGSASGPAIFGVLSTEWGVVAAFPAIAIVSVILAVLFFLLSRSSSSTESVMES